MCGWHWTQMENKGAFSLAALSFWGVLTQMCVLLPPCRRRFRFRLLNEVTVRESSHVCVSGPRTGHVHWVCSCVSSTQHIDTVCVCVCVCVRLVESSWIWLPGKWEETSYQTAARKSWNRNTGHDFSPGCGCVWDPASLVHVQVCVLRAHSTQTPHPDHVTWCKLCWRRLENDQCRRSLWLSKV